MSPMVPASVSPLLEKIMTPARRLGECSLKETIEQPPSKIQQKMIKTGTRAPIRISRRRKSTNAAHRTNSVNMMGASALTTNTNSRVQMYKTLYQPSTTSPMGGKKFKGMSRKYSAAVEQQYYGLNDIEPLIVPTATL